MLEKLPIAKLKLDPYLQMREGGCDPVHVAEMTAHLKADGSLERVSIVRVGDDNYVTDGFHTVEAHKDAGIDEVPVKIVEGTYDDAVLAAAQANAKHTARKRTAEDKRKATFRLCEHLEKRGIVWSERKIASHVGVSAGLVASVRQELGERAIAKAEAEDRLGAKAPERQDDPEFDKRAGDGLFATPAPPAPPAKAVGKDGKERRVADRRPPRECPEPTIPAPPRPEPATKTVMVKPFMFQTAEVAIGQLVRVPDRIAETWPEFKGSLEQRLMVENMRNWLEVFNKVKARFTWKDNAKPDE